MQLRAQRARGRGPGSHRAARAPQEAAEASLARDAARSGCRLDRRRPSLRLLVKGSVEWIEATAGHGRADGCAATCAWPVRSAGRCREPLTGPSSSLARVSAAGHSTQPLDERHPHRAVHDPRLRALLRGRGARGGRHRAPPGDLANPKTAAPPDPNAARRRHRDGRTPPRRGPHPHFHSHHDADQPSSALLTDLGLISLECRLGTRAPQV